MTKQKLILVADDEDVIRQLLKRCLMREGYRVATAEDGRQAIELVNKEFVNAVVTDIKMPGADGLEVLKHTKTVSPDTEVLIMTAYASTETAIEAVRHGAFDYFLKPFDHLDDVVRRIRQALDHQSLVIHNRELSRKLEEMNRALKNLVVDRTRELHQRSEQLQAQVEQARRVAVRLKTAYDALAGEVQRAIQALGELAASGGEHAIASSLGRLAEQLRSALESTPDAWLEPAAPTVERGE
ncbi:MAG: hypothetical protein KatS3mg102_1329 [Planctomycetota bacterium]|nr:MAG: hypothetical protein KatS3mg102_1329 [Planctomycetota bacterium]